MDFCDFIEFDHASFRHDDAYLDRFENPHGNRLVRHSKKLTLDEKMAFFRKRELDAMPNLDDEEPPALALDIAGPTVTRWVKRGYIMRFHPDEFFQQRLAPLRPGAELYDSDAIAYYQDDGSGNPLTEFYGHRAPEGVTIFTSDIDEE
jgi:hypothetical protein